LSSLLPAAPSPTLFPYTTLFRSLHSREAVEILEENFGDLVFDTKIRKTVRYAEAPVKGTSVLKYDPSGKAAEAYRQLAKEVLDGDRKSTRLNSSHLGISYAVFCL